MEISSWNCPIAPDGRSTLSTVSLILLFILFSLLLFSTVATLDFADLIAVMPLSNNLMIALHGFCTSVQNAFMGQSGHLEPIFSMIGTTSLTNFVNRRPVLSRFETDSSIDWSATIGWDKELIKSWEVVSKDSVFSHPEYDSSNILRKLFCIVETSSSVACSPVDENMGMGSASNSAVRASASSINEFILSEFNSLRASAKSMLSGFVSNIALLIVVAIPSLAINRIVSLSTAAI
mmetsp:Transcript_13108/g.17569  ORF Transcript_13108/g.17569 Transcript_13108/m.17569 type:complete len:235 (+) Transcript_13108:4067-4771(+)